MEYKKCHLYGLKSKKNLLELLHISRKIYRNSSFISTKIQPYIEFGKKERLIEAPDEDIKAIQRIILSFLQNLDFPNYVYSGIRKKCYIDNAETHSQKRFLFKTDLSKFFPNISRNKVYNFYLKKLNTSPDVANILTNFTTINLNLKQNNSSMLKVKKFMVDKNINCHNHLITGSPLSSIMSYLANVDMFNEIYCVAKKFNIQMTVYVDDVIFSSNKKIPLSFKKTILDIIRKNNYCISKTKTKSYNKPLNKKVTGVILDKKGQMQIPNGLMRKTHNYLEETKKNDYTNFNRLQGCINVIKSINGKYQNLNKVLLQKSKHKINNK